MALRLKGKKIGMMTRFDENGAPYPVTVIQIGSTQVVQLKTVNNDGYSALVLATGDIKEKNVKKPVLGQFKKGNVKPKRHVYEARIDDLAEYAEGSTLTVGAFSGCDFVDVSGTSIGKGYAGLMKLKNYRGGPAAHGSGFHRHGGSFGMRSTPGRCLEGTPQASRMGNRKVTVQSLRVDMIDEEKGLILVKGSIPGAKNGFVDIQKAVKK